MVTETKFTFPEKWNIRFMELAKKISTWSKDESTKVGCVIVGPDKEIRSMGYNGFPRGVDDNNSERHQRPLKYTFFEHAERNSIYNATLYGSSLRNCTIYITMPPCPDCARAIIQSGIKEVIFCAPPNDERINIKGWRETVKYSLEMFDETGVKYKAIDGPTHSCYPLDFGDITKLFNKRSLNNLSEQLIRKNGFKYQASICLEEINEFVTELILRDSFDNTADETADVFITQNHLLVGYQGIRTEVDLKTNQKMLNPKFMETDEECIIAFLNLQKELLKNLNRDKQNLPDIINKISDSRVALVKSVVKNQNFSHVKKLIDKKIQRTIQREFK